MMHEFIARVTGPAGVREFRAFDRSSGHVLAYIGREYPDHTGAVVLCQSRGLTQCEIARRAAAVQFLDSTGI